MTVLSAKKIEQISQSEEDPKIAHIKAVGDLSGVEVFSDLVLLATFIRNERTVGGVIRPLDNVKEDEHQSKVGLVLKAGPLAYADWEAEVDRGKMARVGTWVTFTIQDRRQLQVNGAPCCLVPYERLRMRIDDPTVVF